MLATKRAFALSLALVQVSLTLIAQWSCPVFAQETEPASQAPAPSSTQETIATQSASQTLKGGVTMCVPKGTGIKLNISSVPTNGMRLLDKDLEGNPLPAHVGDVIVAKTTEDIFVEDNKVIPEGTIFRGKVSRVLPPRRVQRPGWVEISFTELTLPSNKTFRFRAQADSFVPSTTKSKLKGAGMIAANAAGGAIVGALAAYQIFGLEHTIAMHGYNIAGGAAIGALLATGHAVMKRGTAATLEPGDNLNLSIDTDLLMPVLTEPTKKIAFKNLEGLEVEVKASKILKDKILGNQLRLDVLITNNSNKRLSSMDLYLLDSNKNKCPIGQGKDEDSGYMFTLEPTSSIETRLYFNTEYPTLKHKLIWYDHQSRKVCFVQNLQ